MKNHLILTSLLATGLTHGASISVNLSPNTTGVDNQSVDPGETSFVGIPGTESIDGSNWNNIDLRPQGTAGVPTTFTNATQGGNNLDLIDSTGLDSGVNLTSSGAFYANFANVSSPNQGATGDAGLMQGFLNLNSNETVSLTGLSTWAPNGYRVIIAFDIGGQSRTYGPSATDGTLSQIFWTNDSSTDSDTDNDGTISWLPTTAPTSGAAVPDANYATFGTFSGDTLTLSGDAIVGRAVISGFQIVAVPEPSSTVLLGLGGLALILRRRK